MRDAREEWIRLARLTGVVGLFGVVALFVPIIAVASAGEPGFQATAADALTFFRNAHVGWIEEALAPLGDRLSKRQIHQLTLAIRSSIGIEALAWLTDIAGLDREEAVELMSWSARALLHAAVSQGPPPDVPASAD